MIDTLTSRSWVEIDLDALSYNLNKLLALLHRETSLMAVVKADGYGHGLVAVAKQCQKLGVKAYAVATIDEGIKLRKVGIHGEILILGYTHPIRARELSKYHLIQSIVDYNHAKMLSRCNCTIDVHIKIDSGMHRLGFAVDDYQKIIKLYKYKNIKIKGYFTHLCVSDSNKKADILYTKNQINQFYQLISRLKQDHYYIGKIHIQSSYGLINYPKIKCDYVRIGIFMYGVKSSINDYLKQELDLKPVLSIKSRIAMIHNLSKGESLGYGLTYQAKYDSVIATIPIGYGDGIPRQISTRGHVLIKGIKCPIIGRICMDQMLVDVSEVNDLDNNEIVIIVGNDGHNEIRIEELAQAAKTISNEILSQIGNRLPKVYVGGKGCYIKRKKDYRMKLLLQY